VMGNDFCTKEVIAWSESRGQSAAVLATVGNELVNCPLATAQTILAKLRPDSTVTIARGSGNVNNDGTLVGSSNDIVTPTVVVPFKGNRISSLGGDRASYITVVHVAVDLGSRNILHGVVVWWGANV